MNEQARKESGTAYRPDGGSVPQAHSLSRQGVHRTFPVVPSALDSSFVRTFMIAVLALLVAIIALNVTVDPLGYFGVGLLPRATWDDRDVKAQLLLAGRVRPELLVIGSSRTMKLDPACASAATGLRSFNFGVSGGRPEDFDAIFQFVEAASPGTVKRILLGVEPDILLDDVSLGAFARQSRYLGRFVRAQGMRPEELAAAALGQGATALSFASLVHAARRSVASAPPVTIRADGMLFYTKDEEDVRRGTYDGAKRVAEELPSLRQAFAPSHRLSRARVALLRTTLLRARARSIRVDAFIPPTQPDVAKELASTAFPARLRETDNLLRRLQHEGLLVYHLTVPGERFGIDPRGYFDAYHVMQPNADRLLEILLGAGVHCAVQ